MKILTFEIKLLEPMLVIMLGSGDANQQESFGYIPGAVLRSTLAARYIKQRGLGSKAAQDDPCRRLFFDDQTRFLNAYPTGRQGQRTLPTPLTWYANKKDLVQFQEQRTDIVSIADFSDDPEATLDQPKLIRSEFCTLAWPDGEQQRPQVEFVAAKRRVAMHNFRTTRRVVGVEGAGTLFQYEALAEGERFIGVIMAEDDVELAPLQELLFNNRLSFGKSRSAGYGRVEITPLDDTHQSWPEYRPTEDYEAINDDDEFVVITLLSDALVRDQWGSYAPDISFALDIDPAHLQRDRSSYQTRIIGGFNRKWGLQLPQTLAVKMGSVFVYPAEDVDAAKLSDAQQDGLGERRAEGFGRIAVNWHRYPDLEGRRIQSASSRNDVALDPLTPAGQLAGRIVEHQLRQQLDQLLLKQIAELNIVGNPSKTQLSRVRLTARKALEQDNLTIIDKFLKAIEGKPAHRELQQSRIGTASLYDWVQTHLDLKTIENDLGGRSGSPTLGGIKAEFDPSLRIEYTARLIEGVVKRKLDQLRQEGQ